MGPRACVRGAACACAGLDVRIGSSGPGGRVRCGGSTHSDFSGLYTLHTRLDLAVFSGPAVPMTGCLGWTGGEMTPLVLAGTVMPCVLAHFKASAMVRMPIRS